MGTSRFATVLFGLMLAVGIALGGCFSTREPTPPQTGSDFSPPNQPETLLSNLAAALTKLNVANYERCFARDNFIFYPDPGVAQNNVGLFSNWTLQPNELDVLRNFDKEKDGTARNRLSFGNPRTNNINADSVEYTADYTLTMQHKDSTFQVYVFTGNLIFSMKRGTDNEYRITRWRDAKTTATPCWTELKQHFATR